MSGDMQNNKINFYGICYSPPIKCICKLLIAIFQFMVLPNTEDHIVSFSASMPFKISVLKDTVITMLRLQLSQEIIFVQIVQKR